MSSGLVRTLFLALCFFFAAAHAKHVQGDFSPTKCSNPVRVAETVDADKVSRRAIKKSLIPAQKKNAYYFNGNGRVWTQVFKVKKGQCLGCNDPGLFRPLGDGGVDFCWLDEQMAGVAVNIWKGSCEASEVKNTLKKFSTSGYHDQAVSFAAQYKSKCGKKSKTMWVIGDSADSYSGDNVYAVMKEPGMLNWSYGSK